jgi:hypothetical protein
MAARNGDKVEVVVIGDLYWGTAVVPLPRAQPDPERPQNDNMYAPGLRRLDWGAGAWLLKSFIHRATTQIQEEWAKKNPDNPKKIIVSGYREPSKDDAELLGTEKWRRAVTRVKLFPKGVGGDMKQQIYRIEDNYGWIESRVAPPGTNTKSNTHPFFRISTTSYKSNFPTTAKLLPELWLSTMTTSFSVT